MSVITTLQIQTMVRSLKLCGLKTSTW